jgi:hypothetical protein
MSCSASDPPRAGTTGALSPGAVRASAGISTTLSDLERLFEAVATIASTPAPVRYARDPESGDYWPASVVRPDAALAPAAGCQRG